MKKFMFFNLSMIFTALALISPSSQAMDHSLSVETGSSSHSRASTTASIPTLHQRQVPHSTEIPAAAYRELGQTLNDPISVPPSTALSRSNDTPVLISIGLSSENIHSLTMTLKPGINCSRGQRH